MGPIFRLRAELSNVFKSCLLKDILKDTLNARARDMIHYTTKVLLLIGAFYSVSAYSEPGFGQLRSASEISAKLDKDSLTAIDRDRDCRFFVDGLGKVRTKILDGRYSIFAMRAELVVNIPRANVLRVGQWSRWVDGRVTETSSLAYPPRLSEEHGFDPQTGRYVIQTPFSWGQQLCPGCVNNDEFSGQISELCWWIDIINENGEEERIWYSDYGRNFHLDELFSWPTYAAGNTDKIILWLDHNAPIFSARQDCQP